MQQLLAAAVAHVTKADAPREAQLQGAPSLRAEVLLTATAESKAGQGVVVGEEHNGMDQLCQRPALLTDLQQLLEGVGAEKKQAVTPPRATHSPSCLLQGASGPKRHHPSRAPVAEEAVLGGNQPIRNQEGTLPSKIMACNFSPGLGLFPPPRPKEDPQLHLPMGHGCQELLPGDHCPGGFR